ncbi:MFS transporter [Jiangella ureilytica]|uniref:MFS transporter n=1 Tax=Jiangella ureilytica TaxID=2530374 RepID=A0A4R4RRV7_9ACTN|nr:MFS transporter [Jiangella ureilytica]TDC51979.1 MFS transporter [Jiangella ureilytica]
MSVRADGRRRAGDRLLAVGIVALEFAAAVSTFVASTLLPVVTAELGARDRLGLLVAGSTLGLFVALPLAGTVLRRLGAGRTLALGTVVYAGGLVVAATAQQAGVFALGQFTSGLAGGLLAVFGISAAIRRLDEALRLKVVAASSAMWILPAMAGPAATLALEHAVGWRWTLLVPVPVVLAGRLLVVRAVRGEAASVTGGERLRPAGLLVPAGAAAMVLADGIWPVAVVGAAFAAAGTVALLPAETARLRRGAPAALAAMTLFAAGYVGADSLITVLLTDGYGVGLARAAVVLGAAPLAWGVTSLVVARIAPERQVPAAGLALTATAVGVLAAGAGTVGFAGALVAWALAGVGVGLAYPGLYLRSTTTVAARGRETVRDARALRSETTAELQPPAPTPQAAQAAEAAASTAHRRRNPETLRDARALRSDTTAELQPPAPTPQAAQAAELATAVITAEAIGGLLGRAGGGALASIDGGLPVAYGMFAVVLALAALAATRSKTPS